MNTESPGFEPSEIDDVMLEILEEQIEKRVQTNYQRFQMEKYGNVLDWGNAEPDEGYDERD